MCKDSKQGSLGCVGGAARRPVSSKKAGVEFVKRSEVEEEVGQVAQLGTCGTLQAVLGIVGFVPCKMRRHWRVLCRAG